MTGTDVAATALVLVALAAGFGAAAWSARRELGRDGPARGADRDPAAIAAWHRASRALRRVTHPPRWGP